MAASSRQPGSNAANVLSPSQTRIEVVVFLFFPASRSVRPILLRMTITWSFAHHRDGYSSLHGLHRSPSRNWSSAKSQVEPAVLSDHVLTSCPFDVPCSWQRLGAVTSQGSVQVRTVRVGDLCPSSIPKADRATHLGQTFDL